MDERDGVVAEAEVRDEGDGSKWAKGMIAGVSLTLGLAVGIVGMGLWAGSLSATIDSHLTNQLIHHTPHEKETQIRGVVDREIAPGLRRIEQRLDRIEGILDDRRGR